MGQLYMQKFENWGPVARDEFDGAWAVGLETFAKSGNWGGVENGVKHHGTYTTSWGGYVLLEVDDPQAFQQYQTHHYQSYAHYFKISFEPVVDADAAFAETVQRFGMVASWVSPA